MSDHLAEFARRMLGVELSREDGHVVHGVCEDAATIAETPLSPDDIGYARAPEADEPERVSPSDITGLRSMEATATDVPGHMETRVRRAVAAARATTTSGFVDIESDEAVERARAAERSGGALSGLLYARKDCFDRVGHLAECGSAARAGMVATRTADVVAAMDAHGAVDVGRLHMSEIALSALGRNDHLGPGRNPWDPTRISGGSSSGSAMAVAHRLVDVSLGTDTGGSIRLPAAACGVTGLKPTNGTISSRGVMPLAPSLDTVGVIGTSAEVVGRVLAVLPRPDARPSPDPAEQPRVLTRLMVPRLAAGPHASAAVIAAVDQLAEVLGAAGLRVERCEVPELTLVNQLAMTIMNVEGAASFMPDLRRDPSIFNVEVRRRLERGLVTSAPVYARALQLRRPLRREFLETFLPEGTAVVLPSIPEEALPIELSRSGSASSVEARFLAFSRWTRCANYLGLPALSLPAGVGPAGLPLGLQLVARPFTDHQLLSLGVAFQGATDWHRREPPAAPITS